jgi:membrane-associated phospholipid phosphatase
MFQTEPILWLQSFSEKWLSQLMSGLSFIGQPYLYLILLLLIILMIDFRRGVLITNLLLYTYVAVVVLKTSFALPRPFQVDAAVLPLGVSHFSPTPFMGYGAHSFFGSLPADVIAHYRSFVHPSFGFPSGHCASTVVIWGMIALLFRRKSLAVIAWGLVPLMALSRMYLGMHFLADVLGGTIIGLAVFGGGYLIHKSRWGREFLEGSTSLSTPGSMHRWTIMLALLLPPALLFIPDTTRTQAATLLGLNAGVLLSLHRAKHLRAPWGRGAAFGLCLLVLACMFLIGQSLPWYHPFREIGTLADAALNGIFAMALIAIPVAGSWLAGRGRKSGQAQSRAER